MTWVDVLVPVVGGVLMAVGFIVRDIRRQRKAGETMRAIFESQWGEDEEGR